MICPLRIFNDGYDVIKLEQWPDLYFVAGVVLLCAISYLTIGASHPTILTPYSLVVVAPLFLIGFVAIFVVPSLFAAWSFPLLRGQTGIPKRTKIAAIALILLSGLHLIGGWDTGARYQGTAHILAVFVLNVIFWTALYIIGRSNSKSATLTKNFLFHWLLFAWLAWGAFPWLGEIP